MSVVEGQDFGGDITQGEATSTVEMEQVEPLQDSQSEIYERALPRFHEARNNLQSLLVAGGFGNKDIIRAEFQGDNKHFVTKPSTNGVIG